MNTTQLLASVKRRAYLPDSGTQFSDTEILAIGDEATTEVLLPLLVTSRGDFNIQGAQASVTAGQSQYELPDRCVGAAIVSMFYQDVSGNQWPMTLIDAASRAYYSQLMGPVGPQTVYYLDGSHIVLQPTPAVSVGTLVFQYIIAPSALTTLSMVVVSAAPSTGVVTVTGNPATILGLTIGSVVDITQSKTPHVLQIYGATVTNVGASSVTITVPGGQSLSNVVAGDVLTVAKTTSIPQMPDELHSLLGLETARRIANAITDPRAPALAAEVDDVTGRVMELIDPRVEKQRKRIVNRCSPTRTRINSRWWR